MRRRRELARLDGLLRWRLADLHVNTDQEFAVELGAQALFQELNPGENWHAVSYEMRETFRCDADRTLRAASRAAGIVRMAG